MFEQIKKLREGKGMTQTQVISLLATKGIKVNSADYSRIENGTIDKYILLGIQIEKILKGEQK